MPANAILMATMASLTLAGGLGVVYHQLFGRQTQVKHTLGKLFEDASPSVAMTEAQNRQAAKALKAKQDPALKKRALNPTSWRYKLECQLERANLMLRSNEYLGLVAALAVGVALISWLAYHLPPIAALGIGGASCFVANTALNLKVWWRMRQARLQFPEVLDSMVSCFKTGYGFNRAVQQVADSYPDPWGTEFDKMALEASLGGSLDDLLANLYRRVPNPDVELFIASLLIQKDTGGNLTEMLGNLSHTCRERQKLAGKVAAISAQGKLTAVVVCLVPVLIMALMFCFIGSAVQDFLANIIGQVIMAVMAVWMMIGMGVLWKMVQIDV
jgi:tight adherence protein B